MNSKDKISSQEVTDLIASKASVSKSIAEEFLKGMIATVEDTLLAGDTVKMKGFGTFKLKWNAARKSVNIQTGEDIIIEGYYKVTFTPENSLKDLINEPFAHLEAVRLDGEDIKPNEITNNEIVQDSEESEVLDEEVLEPLRIFTEQAFEIKNILSEINALSVAAKTNVQDAIADENTQKGVAAFETENKSEVSNVEQDIDEDEDDDFVEDEEDVEDNDDAIKENVVLGIEADDAESVINNADVVIPEVDTNVAEVLVADETIVDEEPIENVVVADADNQCINDEIEAEEVAIIENSTEGNEVLTDKNTISENVNAESIVQNKTVVIGGEPTNAIDEDKNNLNSKTESSSFFAAVKPVKKKSRWLIPAVLILMVVLIISTYFICPPITRLGNKTFSKIEAGYVNFRDNFSFLDMFDNAVEWFIPAKENNKVVETIVVPKDTTQKIILNNDNIKDSLQILFETPRVYPEFIANEFITAGSRLAWMSKKYYGLSDFWVYIYEANRDRFDDPDKIPVGALIHIPKLDARLIDKTNKRCVDNAKKLHDVYVKR